VKRRAVLLDRDGTLNVNPSAYVTRLEEFEPIAGAFEAVGRLCRAGWSVSVVTNQSGIGKGLVTSAAVGEIHRECERLAAAHGGAFDGFYVCPDLPGFGSELRKPLPGMLLAAARDHDYDLFRSYTIGDSERDLVAGRAAGTTPLLVLTGHGERTRRETDHPEDRTFASLAEAVDWILTRAAPRG
jgi:D-glycero-D-manno-heptose 1,7-bisphosphate phosphatase